jgi:hypothetical protein
MPAGYGRPQQAAVGRSITTAAEHYRRAVGAGGHSMTSSARASRRSAGRAPAAAYPDCGGRVRFLRLSSLANAPNAKADPGVSRRCLRGRACTHAGRPDRRPRHRCACGARQAPIDRRRTGRHPAIPVGLLVRGASHETASSRLTPVSANSSRTGLRPGKGQPSSRSPAHRDAGRAGQTRRSRL